MVAEMPEDNGENQKIENIKSCDTVLVFLEREMRKKENLDTMIDYLTVMTILASVRRDLAVGTHLDGIVSFKLSPQKSTLSPREAADALLRELGYEC